MTAGERAVESRVRLFVAVEVPKQVRAAVDAASALLQRRAAGAKWVDPAQWHLTLAFIGWVGEADRTRVEEACARAAGAGGPFELRLTGRAGMFGRRVLWVGIEESAALMALAEAVRTELVAAGFAIEERPFRAHLTLARARRGEPLPANLADGYQGPMQAWTVERFVLVRSRLRRDGARYTTEAAWRL